MPIGKGFNSNRGTGMHPYGSSRGGTGMHPYGGSSGNRNKNDDRRATERAGSSNRDKLVRSLRKLRDLIASRQVEAGQPVAGSYLRNTCQVYSTCEEDRFIRAAADSGLAYYERKTDTYRIAGGDDGEVA